MSVTADRSAVEFDAVAEGMFQVGDILDAGIVAVDENLRIIRWNSWIESTTGLHGDALAGRDICEVFPALKGTPREDAFRRAVAGEMVVMSHRFHEYLLPIECGPMATSFQHMQQNARIVPLHGATQIIGAIAFVQDVSERAAREEELSIARDAAESASRAKSDFLAAMSHELRTPLTAVIGYADLLVQEIGGTLEPIQKQHAERIKASAWHLIGLINEVLTFSRAEAGMEELLFEEVDICAAARQAMTLVEPQAEAKGITVSVHAECDPLFFESDALRIQQIFINLLGNAVKFTEEGRVGVRIAMEGTELVVRVHDSGPGVPEAHRKKIFEPFTQADQTATRAKGGTGLGLSVSQKLAKLMGGSIALESSSPAGSTFMLRLPTRAPDAPARST